ncbi:MAG: YlxM family DNA-binding protein [bacterium]
MKALDKQVRNSLLFDFYGNLLTKKQQKAANLYFNCDLNLSEIAEKLKVTRQAVYFSIKNITKDLEKYESSLKLYHNKFSKMKRKKNV